MKAQIFRRRVIEGPLRLVLVKSRYFRRPYGVLLLAVCLTEPRQKKTQRRQRDRDNYPDPPCFRNVQGKPADPQCHNEHRELEQKSLQDRKLTALTDLVKTHQRDQEHHGCADGYSQHHTQRRALPDREPCQAKEKQQQLRHSTYTQKDIAKDRHILLQN